jgi:hypothetical protein
LMTADILNWLSLVSFGTWESHTSCATLSQTNLCFYMIIQCELSLPSVKTNLYLN